MESWRRLAATATVPWRIAEAVIAELGSRVAPATGLFRQQSGAPL
jgi:hypothetical protein